MKQIIHTEKAPAAIGPYSQAVAWGELVITSGQLGIDPESGALPDGIEAQTQQALKNLDAVLEKAGANRYTVVKTTVFLKDLGDFAKVNQLYADYFDREEPARSCVQVAALPKDAAIEIEAIAYRVDK